MYANILSQLNLEHTFMPCLSNKVFQVLSYSDQNISCFPIFNCSTIWIYTHCVSHLPLLGQQIIKLLIIPFLPLHTTYLPTLPYILS
jgi:hypothetical protein